MIYVRYVVYPKGGRIQPLVNLGVELKCRRFDEVIPASAGSGEI